MKSLSLLVVAIALVSFSVPTNCSFKLPNFREFTRKAVSIAKHAKQALIGAKGNGEYPEFYHDLKCPNYTVVSTGDGYEERCYAPTSWVMTSALVPHRRRSSFSPMFKKLFAYIEGENKNGTKIPMAAPVLVTIRMKNKDTLYAKMHFFLPPTNTNLTAPEPTNPDVKIANYKAHCAYVRVYSGWQMGIDRKLKRQRDILAKALDKAKADYGDKMLIYAGYDAPWKVFNRHNEVMLLKKSSTPVVKPDIAA